jgi:putative photosynthetic complex assembly protein
MTTRTRKPPPFPRGTLLLAAIAVLSSIGLAAAGRITGAADSAPRGTAVMSRDLLFKDMPNGGVAVFDAGAPMRLIEIVPPETNGFLRAAVRGLAQQRLRQDANVQVPFRLTEWADGRLTLEDPTDGRRIEMEAFGITNEQAFARLLMTPASSS